MSDPLKSETRLWKAVGVFYGLAQALVGITLAYAAAVVVTFEVLMPLQAAAFPDYGSFASLFYLPHAIRVLAAWWFGWLSIPLLLPAIVIEVGYLYGADATLVDYVVAGFTAVGPALSFWLLAQLGYDVRARRGGKSRWPDLVAVGAFASVLGLIGPALFYGDGLPTLAAFLMGDVTGLLLVFLPLCAALRRRCL